MARCPIVFFEDVTKYIMVSPDPETEPL
jgi:hypothetical protein